MPLPGSSRWCPTPEQLMILEEIYKGGIRTPNASQIQQITAHLSLYGKIEGKNVFYWFQNHKARDRQKLRRKQLFLAKQLQQQQQQGYHRHDHLLHSTPTPTPALHHPLNLQYKSPAFLHQLGGGIEDACSSQLKQYTWKPDLQVETYIDKSIKRMYGHDHWMTMMMMDVGPTSSPPCCSRGPPKTLQLFPTTTTTTTSTNPSQLAN